VTRRTVEPAAPACRKFNAVKYFCGLKILGYNHVKNRPRK
jgi:hypothetical protein